MRSSFALAILVLLSFGGFLFQAFGFSTNPISAIIALSGTTRTTSTAVLR